MSSYSQKILDDEIHVAAKSIDEAQIAVTRAHWANGEAESRKFRYVFLFDDGSETAALALNALRESKAFGRSGRVSHCGPAAQADGSGRQQPSFSKRAAALVFADCRRKPASRELWLKEARALFKSLAADRRSLAVVCALLPEIDPLPDGVTALAEREYSALLEAKTEKTDAERFLLDVEALCREAVRDIGARVILLRAPHVFGPGVAEEGFSVHGIVEEAAASGKVEIQAEDFGCIRSFTAATDVVAAAWHALLNATPGNTFNMASFEASAAELKRALQALFPDRFALSANCPAGIRPEYRCLSAIKFGQTAFRRPANVVRAMSPMAAAVVGNPAPNAVNDAIFRGREPQIRALEMDILREIDRICEKHGIKYFLAAGTLLGAKRYGHSIPWDDDLDVGFLRSEFKKFRKVAEKELPPHMAYCAWYNDANAHYTVDKIRIRDTWYSTKYSSNKVMPDGVFVDFLVYDPTSDIPFVAKIHNKVAGVFQWFLLFVLWYGLKRRDFLHGSYYFLYKLVRVVPLRAWHWLYERWLTLFWFKKHPKFLLDSLGARAGIKLVPAQGLSDTVRIPFDEGFMAPSPEDPEPYLRFAYGQNWRENPPISEQMLHHNPARIDLGAYLAGGSAAAAFRRVDLRGELFEPEGREER